MSFQAEHIGLYFGQAQIKLVQEQHKKHPHLQTAWQWLLAEAGETVLEIEAKHKDDEAQIIIKPQLDAQGQALEAAFRYRFLEDESAAEIAISFLSNDLKLKHHDNLLETVQATLIAAHCFEMLREVHPDANQWLEEFASFTEKLAEDSLDAPTLEQLSFIPLQIVRGVVLDDSSHFEAGCSVYRQVIDELIHPEGYIKPVVKDEKDAVKAYRDMTLATGALVLTAEAATQAGLNLYDYKNRDVSIHTAATYLVFYYFYPDKWQWGESLSAEDTESIFRDSGAWLDILAYHQIPRGAEILLDQQRPFFSSAFGGLTTLSHFKAKRGKFLGLFG